MSEPLPETAAGEIAGRRSSALSSWLGNGTLVAIGPGIGTR